MTRKAISKKTKGNRTSKKQHPVPKDPATDTTVPMPTLTILDLTTNQTLDTIDTSKTVPLQPDKTTNDTLLTTNINLSSGSEPTNVSARAAKSCTTTATSNTHSRHNSDPYMTNELTTNATLFSSTVPTQPSGQTSAPLPIHQLPPATTESMQDDTHLSSPTHQSDSSNDDVSTATTDGEETRDSDDTVNSSPPMKWFGPPTLVTKVVPKLIYSTSREEFEELKKRIKRNRHDQDKIRRELVTQGWTRREYKKMQVCTTTDLNSRLDVMNKKITDPT